MNPLNLIMTLMIYVNAMSRYLNRLNLLRTNARNIGLKHWKKKCKPLHLPDCYYLEDAEGKLYLVCNGELIEVSEHFAENGKTIGELLEDFIIYLAKQV
ncbi:MAG: hypothetical protein ACI4JG_01570 [Acutalibacteraceae bacterium]